MPLNTTCTNNIHQQQQQQQQQQRRRHDDTSGTRVHTSQRTCALRPHDAKPTTAQREREGPSVDVPPTCTASGRPPRTARAAALRSSATHPGALKADAGVARLGVAHTHCDSTRENTRRQRPTRASLRATATSSREPATAACAEDMDGCTCGWF